MACGCKVEGGISVGGPGQPDVIIDVAAAPYETGFKFNTLPFGGMTIDRNNAVRIGSASDVKIVPAAGSTLIIGTAGSAPTPSSTYRGAVFLVQGAGGVADVLQICLKSSADTYSWKTIVTG